MVWATIPAAHRGLDGVSCQMYHGVVLGGGGVPWDPPPTVVRGRTTGQCFLPVGVSVHERVCTLVGNPVCDTPPVGKGRTTRHRGRGPACPAVLVGVKPTP